MVVKELVFDEIEYAKKFLSMHPTVHIMDIRADPKNDERVCLTVDFEQSQNHLVSVYGSMRSKL